MSNLNLVRTRVNNLLHRFVKDEEGNSTIDNILLIALAAVLLTLGFKFLWGTGNEGIIPVLIKTVIDTFTGSLSSWLSG